MSSADKSKEDVLNAISNMSVIEIVDLIKNMEEKFGVSAAAATVAVAAAPGAAAVDVEEKTEFSVKLEKVNQESTVGVIKIVREVNPQLGLREAKDLVDAVKNGESKIIKEGMSKADADGLVKKLKEAKADAKME